jgi:hypothetical protein
MSFRKGDHVVSNDGEFGVGTVVEDRGDMGGVHMYRVAWPMPEGAMPQTLSMPKESLRPWSGEDDARAE